MVFDLDTLLDIRRSSEQLKKGVDVIDSCLRRKNSEKMASPSKKGTPRKTRPPKLHDEYVTGTKSSSYCPKCRKFVSEEGVVCTECNAYWHYSCAGVSQRELDECWVNQDFLCAKHRSNIQDRPETKVYEQPVIRTKSEKNSESNCKTGTVVTNIKIVPYKMNDTTNLRKMIKKIDQDFVIEAKDMGKQYTISLSTATFHLLLNNIVSVGKSVGIQIVRDDVDVEGSKLSKQFNVSPSVGGIVIPITIIFYHTTNNVLVQLKGKKSETNWNKKLESIEHFVYKVMKPILFGIEGTKEFNEVKEGMRKFLNTKLECGTSKGPKEDNFSLNDLSEVGSKVIQLEVIETDHGLEEFAQDGRERSEDGKETERTKTPPKREMHAKQPKTPLSQGSPRKSPWKKARCSADCEKSRLAQNLKIVNLEKEKQSLQQKLDTLEKHQETLKGTIASKESLIQTQNKLITDHCKTISSQKDLIADLEIKVATHNELASSFMDIIVSDDDESETNNSENRETHALQRMHDKIRSLEEEATTYSGKINMMEEDIKSKEVAAANLKLRFDAKSKEHNGLRAQLAIVEETTLAREKKIKEMNALMAESKSRVEMLSIDNSKLREKLVEMENTNNSLTAKVESSRTFSADPVIIEQLTMQLQKKDQEISDLRENADFSEKTINEARMSWKDESKMLKRTQALLENEKVLRIKSQEECCSLKLEVQGEKAKLQRTRTLLKLSSEGAEKSQEVESETVKSKSIDGSMPRVEKVVLQNEKEKDEATRSAESEQVSVCIFELREAGSCQRKEKCKYNHDIPVAMRNGDVINKIMEETSLQLGKCAFEMTLKGSCPGNPCKYEHNHSKISLTSKQGTRICFRELAAKGSCHWKSQCRFSHNITEEQRNDEIFIQRQMAVKDQKASKCINEFRQRGSCHRKGMCPFSHKIEQGERGNEENRKKMEERGTVLKKRKEYENNKKEEKSVQSPTFLKEVLALRKEMQDEMKELRELIRGRQNP